MRRILSDAVFFMGRCAAGPQALATHALAFPVVGEVRPLASTFLHGSSPPPASPLPLSLPCGPSHSPPFSLSTWVWVPHFSLEFFLQDGFPGTLQFQLPLPWHSDSPSLC